MNERLFVKEIQNIGWNAETISSFGILAFTAFGLYGQYRQARLIWQKQSTKGIEPFWLIGTMFMFAGYALEGLTTNKGVTLVSSSARIAFYVPIVIGISKFTGFTAKQKWIAVGLGLLLLPMLVGGLTCEVFMTVLASTCLVGAFYQSFRIWKNRSAGNLSIALLSTLAGSTACWTWYAFLFKAPALCGLSALFFIAYGSSAVLWVIFRPSKTEPQNRAS